MRAVDLERDEVGPDARGRCILPSAVSKRRPSSKPSMKKPSTGSMVHRVPCRFRRSHRGAPVVVGAVVAAADGETASEGRATRRRAVAWPCILTADRVASVPADRSCQWGTQLSSFGQSVRSSPRFRRNPHAQGRRHRPRHHQLGRLRPRGRRPGRHPQRRGRAARPRRSSPSPRTARSSSARSPSARPSPTPTARSAPSSATWAPTGPIDIDGKKYTAQEISARTLQKLKRDAEAYLGDTVTQAVITVPAYFDDAQRTATKEAGQIAGLEVLRIINEPTAAALAYGLDKEAPTTRRSSCSTSAAAPSTCRCSRSATACSRSSRTHGDTNLGGDDWDQRVIDWLVADFKGAYGVDLAADNMAVQRLKEAAEKAKIELSARCSRPRSPCRSSPPRTATPSTSTRR